MKRSFRSEPTHFRLCHRCLHLNESDSEVLRCEHCQKSLGASLVAPRLEPDPRRGVWEEADDMDEETSTRRHPPLAGLSAIF